MTEQVPTIWTFTDLTLIAFWSFVCASLLVVIFTPLARVFNLVDEPDDRKQHIGSIPLVGGLSIAASVMVVMIWAGALAVPTTGIFLTIGLILGLLGMLDDYSEISPRYRLLVQIIVGLALCFVADLKIVSVGDLVGNGYVTFGLVASVIFTVICSVGVFNSINMIDGIDGLAGTIVFLSAAAMVSIAFSAGDLFSAGVLISVVSAVAAYLVFNLSFYGKARKVFMGDSGSLFLGFTLLWFFIYLSQGENAPMSPVVAGWIFGLPLADTVAVIVGRLIRGEHPLAAGRDHIHHRLLRHGFSSKTVLKIIALYHLIFVLIGVLFNETPSAEPFLFWGFVIITVIHFFVLTYFLPHSKNSLHSFKPR